jgi:hypothetical protein
MKTAEGKVAMDDDNNNVVVIVRMSEGDVKHPLNIKSIGGKEYGIGEKVKGIITEDGRFNVCREYVTADKRNIFGFISNDELDNDFITITVIKNYKPKSDLSKTQETIDVLRDAVVNYYDNNENKR